MFLELICKRLSLKLQSELLLECTWVEIADSLLRAHEDILAAQKLGNYYLSGQIPLGYLVTDLARIFQQVEPEFDPDEFF